MYTCRLFKTYRAIRQNTTIITHEVPHPRHLTSTVHPRGMHRNMCQTSIYNLLNPLSQRVLFRFKNDVRGGAVFPVVGCGSMRLCQETCLVTVVDTSSQRVLFQFKNDVRGGVVFPVVGCSSMRLCQETCLVTVVDTCISESHVPV